MGPYLIIPRKYPDMYTFRGVWLLRNLSLDDKLCLHYDKNVAFV